MNSFFRRCVALALICGLGAEPALATPFSLSRPISRNCDAPTQTLFNDQALATDFLASINRRINRPSLTLPVRVTFFSLGQRWVGINWLGRSSAPMGSIGGISWLFSDFQKTIKKLWPQKTLSAAVGTALDGHPEWNPERILRVQRIINSGGILTSDAIRALILTGSASWLERTGSWKDPLPTLDRRPFVQALMDELRAHKGLTVLGLSNGTAARQMAQDIMAGLQAKGITADRILLVRTARSFMKQSADEVPFMSYTADDKLIMDVSEAMDWLITQANMAQQPSGIDKPLPEQQAIRRRIVIDGFVGAATHDDEESFELKTRMVEWLTEHCHYTYKRAETTVKTFQEGRASHSFPADVEAALRALSSKKSILQLHRFVEKRWSIQQFKDEAPSYFFHSYPLAEFVMQTLKETNQLDLNVLMKPDYWFDLLKHPEAKQDETRLDAIDAAYMVWAAHERVMHRDNNVEASKMWPAKAWTTVLAEEIAFTEWRMTPSEQSKLGTLAWGEVKDNRPRWAQKEDPREIAPLFIPKNAESRKTSSLRQAIEIANSRGGKFLVVPNKATKAQFKTFLRMSHILESHFYYDDGLATGGTQETHHFATALLAAGLKPNAYPEAKAFAGFVIALFENTFREHEGRLRSTQGGGLLG